MSTQSHNRSQGGGADQETAPEAVGKRAVPEWVADHPDQEIPKRVKLRIWERERGRCYLTGRRIMPGDAFEFEHVIAITNGGQHRESNIRLALSDAHKVKTGEDRKVSAKLDRVSLKHKGLWPKSKTPIRSRGFQSTRPIPKEAAP